MENFKDIWASIVHGVRERTTNPLTFAFIASTCCWNYRFFMILAGDGTVASRFDAIDKLYAAGKFSLLDTVAIPLFIALAYVFVYPFVSRWVIRFYRAQQIAIANTVKEVELGRVLTRKEAADMTTRHELERKRWEKNEAELNQQNNELRNALMAVTAVDGQAIGTPVNTGEILDADGNKLPKEEEEEEEEEEHIVSALQAIALLSDREKKVLKIVEGNHQSLEMDVIYDVSRRPKGASNAEIAEALHANFTIVELATSDLKDAGYLDYQNARFVLTPEAKRTAAKIVELKAARK